MRQPDADTWFARVLFRLFCLFYCSLVIATLVDINKYSTTENALVTISRCVSYVLFVFLAVVPFYLARMNYLTMKRNQEEAEYQEPSRFLIWSREELKDGMAEQAMYYPVFFWKRLLLPFVAIGLRGLELVQISGVLLVNLCAFAFALRTQPFKDFKSNVVLTIEEGTQLVVFALFFLVDRDADEKGTGKAILYMLASCVLIITLAEVSEARDSPLLRLRAGVAPVPHRREHPKAAQAGARAADGRADRP